jgi:hypothetical protein
MTTKRWMIAVAAVAVVFGGYRYAIELRARRAGYLARAAMHAKREAEGRLWFARVARLKAQPPRRPAPAEPPPSMTRTELRGAIDWVKGRPADPWRQQLEAATYREDQEARERAVADSRRTIMAERERRAAESVQRAMESNRRLMEYHAALVRKYRRAARYPWLSVEPDPPGPEP